MNISTNLSYCAVKQVERDEINAKLTEFLAKGGKIKTAENTGMTTPVFCQENKLDLSDRAQKVLNSIKAGKRSTLKIAQAANIGEADMIAIVKFLLSKKLIEQVGSQNRWRIAA